MSSANGGTAFLLTDGSVLMQECMFGYGTRRWWKLVPDNLGSYFNGTWRRVHDSHVGRKYFASAIFANGRLLVCGGEYSDAGDETNRCEVYDPVADAWTEISPPADANGTAWSKIGDAACSLLSDGTFVMGNSEDDKTAIFDPNTVSWMMTDRKAQPSSEESWTMLRDGAVITPNCSGHPASERFVPANNGWSIDGNVPASSDLVENASSEIGPGVLLPDGRAFYVGATGKTALYNPAAAANLHGKWTDGPALPMAGNQEQGAKDGPDVCSSMAMCCSALHPSTAKAETKITYRRPAFSSSTAPRSMPPAIHRAVITPPMSDACSYSRMVMYYSRGKMIPTSTPTRTTAHPTINGGPSSRHARLP